MCRWEGSPGMLRNGGSLVTPVLGQVAAAGARRPVECRPEAFPSSKDANTLLSSLRGPLYAIHRTSSIPYALLKQVRAKN